MTAAATTNLALLHRNDWNKHGVKCGRHGRKHNTHTHYASNLLPIENFANEEDHKNFYAE